MDYDFAKLDTLLEQWIAQYRAVGKKEWVALLESDRKLLANRELQRPALLAAQRTQALEQENAKLQGQIDQLKTAVQETRNQTETRRVTYYSNPFPYQYYYNPTVYVRPISTPPVCPPAPPVCPPRPQPNYTGGSGPPNTPYGK